MWKADVTRMVGRSAAFATPAALVHVSVVPPTLTIRFELIPSPNQVRCTMSTSRSFDPGSAIPPTIASVDSGSATANSAPAITRSAWALYSDRCARRDMPNRSAPPSTAMKASGGRLRIGCGANRFSRGFINNRPSGENPASANQPSAATNSRRDHFGERRNINREASVSQNIQLIGPNRFQIS